VNVRLEALLTVAATTVAIAFFASVPYWPKEPVNHPITSFVTAAAASLTSSKAPLLGPSVLASLAPVPDLNLELPTDFAVVAARRGINGETGLIPTAASITTFRLRATGDLVSVAAPTGVSPVRRSPGDTGPDFLVRGSYAVATVDRGSTVLRWTEHNVTYEISSRTLDAAKLAEVANKLR
jgi:hypothetical protein